MYLTHRFVWYPALSYTLRNRTWTPDAVNMGTWNSTLIGGLSQDLGLTVLTSSMSAESMHSALPGNFFIRQTIAFCSGSYFARPNEFLIFDLDVFFGTGTLITTCVANSFSEKLAMTLRLIEHLVCPSSCTAGISRKGMFTLSLTLYLISSNSPSGGMKVIVLSASNFPNLTHLWNVQSSISTPEFFLPSEDFSMTSLSFRPNLHSGIPVNFVFICTRPVTSLRRTFPADEIKRLTDSRTSM
mmetsp:Transcript_4492/g.9971  ORF Transcript_4492/g.9971 Transcript_4492/m.9971 type:complete len:242 (-) Transcript_4492:645-1370(-)